jgi:hypothetical protein
MDKRDYVTLSENCVQVALTEHYDEMALTTLFAIWYFPKSNIFSDVVTLADMCQGFY